MDVRRDFARRPPREELDSVSALKRDFSWRFPRSDRDPVADYTAEARTLHDAIERACDSLGADGKMSNHQSRVPEASRMILSNKLQEVPGRQYVGMSFDDLHDLVEHLGNGIRGIGPVTTYDVAYRVSCWLGMPVESLYLHAGVRAGYNAMRVWLDLPTVGPKVKRVGKQDLPRELRRMDMNDVEDWMCTYREVFKDLADGIVYGDDNE